jgi:hypothetical protein
VKFHRRLDALERQFISEPTILTMPDGSTATITGPDDYLVTLLALSTRCETATPGQAAHLKLIRECTSSKEPGGAQLVDLIRCFLLGPVGEEG